MHFTVVVFVSFIYFAYCMTDDDDPNIDPVYRSTDPSIREPSPCEVCKFFATELMTRLRETSSKMVIETGHGLDKTKSFQYQTSELRLTEALLDPHVCDKILEYQVHAERKGSLRYEKGRSETMSVLHALQHKGVKVELGFPEEMWDEASTEVSKMQRACYTMAEAYEDDIEKWYYDLQATHSLLDFLCRDRYLVKKRFPSRCLSEVKDQKLIDKDASLRHDNEHMENTASKKQQRDRAEWAAIRRRQVELEQVEARAKADALRRKAALADEAERKEAAAEDDDVDVDADGFEAVKRRRASDDAKLDAERTRSKGDAGVKKETLSRGGGEL